jgi:hypothetical protein
MKLPEYYELPCYPDKKPSKYRALIVNVHSGWMGKRDDHVVFIGGGGHGTFKTRAQALSALHDLVSGTLYRRVNDLQAQLDYATKQLKTWEDKPWLFAADKPPR